MGNFNGAGTGTCSVLARDPIHTKRLRDNGVKVNYCCTNDASMLGRLLEDGVEFPLVDRVGEMLKVADKHGIARLKPSIK